MSVAMLPVPTRIERIEPLAADHRLYTLLPALPLTLDPGQFIEMSLPGIGAFPVSACDLVRDGRILTCIRRAGRVTSALFGLEEGAVIGLRGPFGNGFPLEAFSARDALLVAGGLGIAPLRGLLQALLAEPASDRRILLLYGAREPQALLFLDELRLLARSGRISLHLSVDFAEELPGPSAGVVCQVGVVSELLGGVRFDPERTAAALCGPPVLYRCLVDELLELGIPAGQIFATLERRMRCGIGQCCHCVAGGVFLCQEGPVFSAERLRTLEGVC